MEIPGAGGVTFSLPLLDLSVDGVCFALEDLPEVPVGSTLPAAVVRVGDVAVTGRLTVVHVTPEFASGVLCGARFEPATEDDRSRLAALVARLLP